MNVIQKKAYECYKILCPHANHWLDKDKTIPWPVEKSTTQQAFIEGVKYTLSTDAIVSMYDALLGHHPVPDALAKWDNLHEHLDKDGVYTVPEHFTHVCVQGNDKIKWIKVDKKSN